MLDLVQTTSQATGYLPGMLFLSAIFIVIFFSLKVRGATTWAAFTASSFLNFILVMLSFAIVIVPGWFLIISILLLPLGFFGMYVSEGR